MNSKSNFGVTFDHGFYSESGMSGFVLGPRQTLVSAVFLTEEACADFLDASKVHIGLNFEDDHFLRIILRATDKTGKIIIRDSNFLVNPRLLSYNPVFMQPESAEVYFYAVVSSKPGAVAGVRRVDLDPHFAQIMRSYLKKLERGALSAESLRSLYDKRSAEGGLGLEYSEVLNGRTLIDVISIV